jgi:RNA polymerase sigma-32 factor
VANEVYTSNSNQFVKSFVDPLTRDQEQDLFVWLHTARRAGDRVRINYYMTKITSHYSPIVAKSAKDLAGYGMDREDLVSEGLVALVEAANRFDVFRGLRFSTYAKWWVKGVMYTYIVKNYFLVNVCTNHTKKKLFFALRKLLNAEMKDTGNFTMTQARAEQIAEMFDATPDEVMQIYLMFRNPCDPLSAPINNEDGDLTKEDTIDSGTILVSDEFAGNRIARFQKELIVEAMVVVLDERERDIVDARVLSTSDDKLTLQDLGNRWEVSKERIRQIETIAMKKLRTEILRIGDIQGLNSGDLFLS